MTIRCYEYTAHQSEHRRDGDRWVCGRCEPDEPEDVDEPEDLGSVVRDLFPDRRTATA
jgi:hypothetical protein